jgi:hypothetical protein
MQLFDKPWAQSIALSPNTICTHASCSAQDNHAHTRIHTWQKEENPLHEYAGISQCILILRGIRLDSSWRCKIEASVSAVDTYICKHWLNMSATF